MTEIFLFWSCLFKKGVNGTEFSCIFTIYVSEISVEYPKGSKVWKPTLNLNKSSGVQILFMCFKAYPSAVFNNGIGETL